MSTQDEPEPERVGWLQRHDDLHKPDVPMPGPWTWEIHDSSMATLCGGGEDAITGHIMSVGPCRSCYKDKEEWEWGRCQTPTIENARLIAAAPDQNVALQTAPRPFTAIESDPDGLSAFIIAYADWFFKTRGAALAKATGSES